MRIKNLSDQFIYAPNRKKGVSVFSGQALASKGVYEVINTEGIDFISKKMIELIEYRKELFGCDKVEYFGMYNIQRFYDLKNRVIIKIKEVIDNPNKDFTLEIDQRLKNLDEASNIMAYRVIKSGDSFRYRD